MQHIGHAEFPPALRLDKQRALGNDALDLTFRAPVLRGVAFIAEQKTALPQMVIELAGQVFGRTYVQRMLENFGTSRFRACPCRCRDRR